MSGLLDSFDAQLLVLWAGLAILAVGVIVGLVPICAARLRRHY